MAIKEKLSPTSEKVKGALGGKSVKRSVSKALHSAYKEIQNSNTNVVTRDSSHTK